MVKQIRATVAGLAILLASFHASAGMITYDFYDITGNGGEDLTGQLSLTIWSWDMANDAFNSVDGSVNQVAGWTDLDDTQILFTVNNNVGFSSNITEVYFHDGLLGPSVALNSLTGFTNFVGGDASPGNLPGGNTVTPDPFIADTEFSADVANGPGGQDKGVNSSDDTLGILLGLGSLGDYDGVVAAVADGSLRFGLHVTSIEGTGGSNSFVNNPDGDNGGGGPSGVPVPGTLFLLGLGLVGIARSRRVRA